MTHWRLLVVDDDAVNRDLIGEFLAGQPFSIDYAENGESAWRRLAADEASYDALILDRMMPDIDGIEVLRRVKGDPRYALLPVIMQSAAIAPAQIREGLAAGAYYYLTKPFLAKALLGIVWAALEDLRRERNLVTAVGKHSQDHVTRTLAMADHDYEFATLEEADRLAVLFAAQCPVPATAAMGLIELLVNAVEHGNLDISYREKMRLKQEDRWLEEIERRLALPRYRDRRATICMTRDHDSIRFIVTDSGKGFDCRAFLEFDPARAFDPNGRGIAMARQIAFTQIEYQGCGNVAIATIPATAKIAGSETND
jgi:DNA-binding response OmpR family regulator